MALKLLFNSPILACVFGQVILSSAEEIAIRVDAKQHKRERLFLCPFARLSMEICNQGKTTEWYWQTSNSPVSLTCFRRLMSMMCSVYLVSCAGTHAVMCTQTNFVMTAVMTALLQRFLEALVVTCCYLLFVRPSGTRYLAMSKDGARAAPYPKRAGRCTLRVGGGTGKL